MIASEDLEGFELEVGDGGGWWCWRGRGSRQTLLMMVVVVVVDAGTVGARRT